MEENRSQQVLIKIIVLFAGLIFVTLLITGIVQTIVHNNLLSQNAQLEEKNEQVQQNLKDAENEDEIKSGDEYLDDYLEQEEGYGEDGEVIIIPPAK